MTPAIAILIYKVACLFTGTAICWMGYRLFSEGVFKSSGDINATFNNTRLVIKRGAPGTFFVVFGSGILIAALLKGMVVGPPPSPSEDHAPTRIYSSGLGDGGAMMDQANAQALHIAYSKLWKDPETHKNIEFSGNVELLRSMRDSILRSRFTDREVIAFYKFSSEPGSMSSEDATAAQKIRMWLAEDEHVTP